MDRPPDSESGEAVLARATARAQATWGERLLAAYALGSLAHGGFSPLVSDVDLGLILADPLSPEDAGQVAALTAELAGSAVPLGDRLSVFWGTLATLRGDAPGGRFPPLDRLDLLQGGRLLTGRDVRAGLPAPTYRDLVVGAVEFALGSLTKPEVFADLHDPAGLIAAGPRRLTKRILFPIRFLYTARTGEIGENEAAVRHFCALASGPIAELAAAAFRWRTEPPAPGDAGAITLVAAGLLPLYQLFLDDHEARMRDDGEPELARRLAAWRSELLAGSGETGP